MSAYHYQPLPAIAETGRTPKFTRLLFLYPATSADEPFHGHLKLIDVEHAPLYEALSYTWGPPSDQPRDYIWLQGCPLPIKPNLEAALRSLRLPNQRRRLWIDAICINQDDVDERSRQVQYMRSIYKHAARVVVWLGSRTPGIEEAFQIAERFAEIRETLARELNSSASGSASALAAASSSSATDRGGSGSTTSPAVRLDQTAINSFIGSMVEDLPDTSMQNLRDLFERPYFRRCWCVQEVVASAWAIAKCDDLEMSFFDLVATGLTIAFWSGEMNMNRHFEMWQSVAEARRPRTESQPPVQRTAVEGSMGSLLDLLDSTRNFLATDPRDKIFALLGICDEGIQPVLALTQVMGNNHSWFLRALRSGATRLQTAANSLGPGIDFGRPAELKSNYNIDTVSVYTNLARFLIRKPPRVLDVLSHVQHMDEPGSGGYPSWVPKWFESRDCYPFRGCFLAGLCRRFPFAELRDNPFGWWQPERPRVLSLDGYRVDLVERVTDVLTFTPDDADTISVIENTWLQLFGRPMVPRTGMRYRDGTPLDEAFCKAMSVHPLGIIVGMAICDSATVTQFELRRETIDSMVHLTHEQRDELGNRAIRDFLTALAGNQAAGEFDERMTRIFRLHTAADTILPGLLVSIRIFGVNRRIFVTRDGRIGLGPRAMRPGDELVVMFGHRMPFIVRPRHDHQLLVGDCVVVDDELMWGNTTEAVRFNRGGPTRVTFDLH